MNTESSSGMKNQVRRYLLLLDLNGTLLLRTEWRLQGAQSLGMVGRKHLYGRPGTREMIRMLHASGRFSICVYTSMTRRNAAASLQAVLDSDSTKVDQLLARDMCKPDFQATKKWDSMRDMAKVWRRFPQDNETNTILVVSAPHPHSMDLCAEPMRADLGEWLQPGDCDDWDEKDNEFRKFRETADNGILIPELFAPEVLSGSSTVLHTLSTYLLQLAFEQPPDVRQYMRENPLPISEPQSTPEPAPVVPNVVPQMVLNEMENAAHRLEQLSFDGSASNSNVDPMITDSGEPQRTGKEQESAIGK